MRTIVDYLLRPQGNVEEIVLRILHDSDVRVSRSMVVRQLREHPAYPSLSAVSDVLFVYGIETLALRIDSPDMTGLSEQYHLVQVKQQERSLFALIYNKTAKAIEWYNPIRHCRETISFEGFFRIYTGYVMLIDATNKKDDKAYTHFRCSEVARQVIETVILLIPFLMAVVSISLSSKLFHIILTLLLLTGIIAGLFLLLYEHNQQSEIVKRFCSLGQQTDCNDILHSRASRLMGIPWAIIGMAYFTGLLFTLCLSGLNVQTITMMAFLHIPALGYVAYSIYYQAHIAKKWCPICLSVQAVIVAVFISFLTGGVYTPPIHISLFTLFVVLSHLLLSFVAIYFLWLLSIENRAHKYYQQEEQHLKYDKDVFWTLLNKSRKIETPSEELGIIIGKPKANINIVKVCHPFCGHCADAHPFLQRIVDNNEDINLQVIFATNPDEANFEKTPINLFLSLRQQGANMEEVLEDWYSSPDKSLESFAARYAIIQQNTSKNKEEAKKMFLFCKEAEVVGTPTIFINGNELPHSYRVEELLYCLS